MFFSRGRPPVCAQVSEKSQPQEARKAARWAADRPDRSALAETVPLLAPAKAMAFSLPTGPEPRAKHFATAPPRRRPTMPPARTPPLEGSSAALAQQSDTLPPS